MLNILPTWAKGYGIPGKVVDGLDMIEIMNTVHDAVEYARSGYGPTLIEMKTYRWKGHSKSDAKKYRTREEENEWRAKDGIKRFKEILMQNGVLTEESAKQLQDEAYQAIEEAVKFAENSPEPSLDSLLEDVFA